MRIGTAIEKLVNKYNWAKQQAWVRDPVAWALYQVWTEAGLGVKQTQCQSTEPQCADGCLYGWNSSECKKCDYRRWGE